MSGKIATFHIEPSKSARSKCKKCKEKIEKGVLRIGQSIQDGEKELTSWHHTKCFNMPRTVNGTSTKGMTVADFVEEHIADPHGVYDDEDKLAEIIADIEAKPPKSEKSNIFADKVASYKRALAAMENDDEEGKPSAAKKAKTDMDEKARAFSVYNKMKNAELQDVLRWNLGYATTGTKDVLLVRCIDGHVNGRLARCPVCSQGKLGLSDEDAGETIKCGGYWDEDLNTKTKCTYAVPNSSAPRLKPWYAEEPSEEQKEEMKEFTEQQIALATGKSPKGAPPELLEAAEKLDWPDTSDPSQRKKACVLMYEVCTSGSVKIDLPEDQKKAKQKIFGLFSTASGPLSATEVLQSVVKEFGIAAAKAEAKAKQEKAIAAGCECAANAAVLQAFQELSELYFKAGNANAGVSSKKVAAAIQALDFEITVDNVMGLSKGPNKVKNIGKSSADKIKEFLSTGTMQKLEEKRMLAA
mmetsp:Transcript_5146/g.7854  ORF Transcript_5146/g.7854 Transcript_5146/m.7854 type:complete len:469 (-) Transcript_5146:853-2259(-)